MSKANGPAGRVPPARRRVGPGLAPAFWRFPAFLGLQTRRPNLSLHRHTHLPAGCAQTALSTKTPVTRSEAPPCVTSFPLTTAARALFPRRSTFRSDAGLDLGKPIRGGHNSTHTAPRRGFSTSTAVCRVTAVVVPHWTWDPRGPDLGDGPLRPRGRGAVACRSNQL